MFDTHPIVSGSLEAVNIWLDDTRPAPTGWLHCRSVDEVKPFLKRGQVGFISLDNDLGYNFCCACGKTDCVEEGEGHDYGYRELPQGYKLVDWMEETGNWPGCRPSIHSANPVRHRYMIDVIAKYYGRE